MRSWTDKHTSGADKICPEEIQIIERRCSTKLHKTSTIFIAAAVAAVAYVLFKNIEVTATVEVDMEDGENLI